jgi:hypothetical protein
MAFYNPTGPYGSGPLYMNAMGATPVASGGGWGAPAGTGPGPDYVTLSPAAQAGMQPSGAGVDWLKLLQATAPVVQQAAAGRQPRASAATNAQAVPGNANAASPLLALLNRQPLVDPHRQALPGLLG